MLNSKKKFDNDKALWLHFLYIAYQTIKLCQKHALNDLLTNLYIRNLFK